MESDNEWTTDEAMVAWGVKTQGDDIQGGETNWSLDDPEEFIRIRQVYRLTHYAVEMAAIRAFLEKSDYPDDIIREIARHYYAQGGTVQELERGVRDPMLFWHHPGLWDAMDHDIMFD